MFPAMRDIIPEGVSGDYSIQHFSISEEQAKLQSIRATYNRNYLGRFIKAGEFCRLKYNSQVLMSDTHAERYTNREIVEKAYGDVLIAGLGLGMILCPILKKEEVTNVTVVEISEEVITLVEPHIRDHLGEAGSKLSIVKADIFDYTPTRKYDVIYFDILGDYSGDEYPDTKKLHKRYLKYIRKGSHRFMDTWMRWDIKDRYFENR